MAKCSCIQCSACSELCPRNLIGHKIHPHLVMRSVAFADLENIENNSEHTLDKLKEANFCCECGICELYSCPMSINPSNMNIYVKSLLRKANIKPDRNVKDYGVHPSIEYRRVSTNRLTTILGLDKYSHVEVDMDNPKEINVSKVSIELRQHIGMPAEAVVKVGDSVSEGQIIAAVPMDKVGANIHSSINGIVESVDTEKIVINGENVK